MVAAVAVAVVAGFAGVALALRPDSQTLGSNTMDQEASRTEPGDDSDREGPQPESFESSDEDSPISAPSSGPESTEDEQEEETTTTIPAPLALPLTGAEISNLTPIPLDFDDLDELLGPADNPSFCEVRPDITGLLETVGAVYPRDPTTDVSLRQIALRMHRFATPEQADGFMESFTTITCDSWESDEYSADGITNLTASVGEPTLVVGDDIRQVDQVATLPNGVDILSRSVVVRHGVDVLKLVFLTVRADELTELTDRLVERATRNLGY